MEIGTLLEKIWALQLFETHKLFGFCPEYIVTSLWVWIPKVDVTIYNGTASEFCRTKPVPTLYRFEISSNYDSVFVLYRNDSRFLYKNNDSVLVFCIIY